MLLNALAHNWARQMHNVFDVSALYVLRHNVLARIHTTRTREACWREELPVHFGARVLTLGWYELLFCEERT